MGSALRWEPGQAVGSHSSCFFSRNKHKSCQWEISFIQHCDCFFAHNRKMLIWPEFTSSNKTKSIAVAICLAVADIFSFIGFNLQQVFVNVTAIYLLLWRNAYWTSHWTNDSMQLNIELYVYKASQESPPKKADSTQSVTNPLLTKLTRFKIFKNTACLRSKNSYGSVGLKLMWGWDYY